MKEMQLRMNDMETKSKKYKKKVKTKVDIYKNEMNLQKEGLKEEIVQRDLKENEKFIRKNGDD